METFAFYALVALLFVVLLAFYTDQYWGPGVRNILNAIATRIAGKEPAVDNGTPKSSWMLRALRALAVVSGIAACIAIWERFFG